MNMLISFELVTDIMWRLCSLTPIFSPQPTCLARSASLYLGWVKQGWVNCKKGSVLRPEIMHFVSPSPDSTSLCVLYYDSFMFDVTVLNELLRVPYYP